MPPQTKRQPEQKQQQKQQLQKEEQQWNEERREKKLQEMDTGLNFIANAVAFYFGNTPTHTHAGTQHTYIKYTNLVIVRFMYI